MATHSFKGAHFATFPPKLVEPCILAGVPERCCAECGAPWERIVEKERYSQRPNSRPVGDARGKTPSDFRAGTPQQMAQCVRTKTIGHRPACKCNGATTAGTVFDPFFGAGTTGLVACELGRRWIGIELNPEYAEMARSRIAPVDVQGDLFRMAQSED